MIQMMGDAGTGHSYGNATAPISEAINVTGPTTIQLQAIRTDEVGAPDIAQIYSNSSQGFTSLRYAQL
ncbi:hypothetical protein PV726_40175 [Streptomyces europaeiscabiei]|nr:hypothetical protein [Streptomyces europaeiscabiei]